MTKLRASVIVLLEACHEQEQQTLKGLPASWQLARALRILVEALAEDAEEGHEDECEHSTRALAALSKAACEVSHE